MNKETKNKLEEILKEDALLINKKISLKEILGKEIMITGASGLIGLNLIMSLKILSDNNKNNVPKITAVFQSSIPEYFKPILNFKNLTIKMGDITNKKFIDSLKKADYIIHAAGYGQPGKFMQDQTKTYEINTSATLSLLKKLKPRGKFLFVSTSEVYSGLQKPPFKETEIGTTNTNHPRACYIEGKRGGETLCNIYFRQGIEAKSARLSLAYGPGTKIGDMRVLNSFIEKALKGNIEMVDRGIANRTYCYIRDAVEIIWQILLNGKEPIYNVGGFSRTTIANLAQKIAQNLKIRVITPKTIATIKGAPDDVRLNMSKVAKEFKKNQKDFISLDEGLKKTIEWQRELYKI